MKLLTRTEEYILLAVWHLGDEAYGLAIRDFLSDQVGRDYSVGSVYVPLERLAARGLVSGRDSEPLPERGGRSKRLYTLTGAGIEALRAVRRVSAGLWQDGPALTRAVAYG